MTTYRWNTYETKKLIGIIPHMWRYMKQSNFYIFFRSNFDKRVFELNQRDEFKNIQSFEDIIKVQVKRLKDSSAGVSYGYNSHIQAKDIITQKDFFEVLISWCIGVFLPTSELRKNFDFNEFTTQMWVKYKYEN